MDQQWIVIYLLIASIQISQQKSTPDSTSYIAAVMEFQPTYIANNSELTLKANSDVYVKYIEIASINNVDIIVFPEDGLTSVYLPEREKMQDWATVIPAASENYVPCTQDTPNISETMKKISCAAREKQIYVVINIAEKLSCTGSTCPKDKVFYNSNVVFDRSGKIIARYRKTNLFVEPQFNVTAVPEIVTFDTDFGVKFGTFICFDILFNEPALKLIRQHQITDIVFPTAWFSEAPFLTAIQVQAGWSFSEDVNLLASGYNRPDSGNTGSGIYLGRKGVGETILAQYSHEEILIYKVPKIQDQTRSNRSLAHLKDHDKEYPYYHGIEHIHDELRKMRKDDAIKANNTLFLLHDNMHVFQTVSLERNISTTICHNDFCCESIIEITKTDPRIKYRLVAFNGVRSFVSLDASVAVCGIVQCENNLLSSCGFVQKSETIFNNIKISATFDNYKNLLIMPSTLNSELLPLGNWTFDEHFHNEHVHITISLDNDTSNLVTFGLYARNFSSVNAAVSHNVVHYVIVLPIILLLGCNFKDTYNIQ